MDFRVSRWGGKRWVFPKSEAKELEDVFGPLLEEAGFTKLKDGRIIVPRLLRSFVDPETRTISQDVVEDYITLRTRGAVLMPDSLTAKEWEEATKGEVKAIGAWVVDAQALEAEKELITEERAVHEMDLRIPADVWEKLGYWVHRSPTLGAIVSPPPPPELVREWEGLYKGERPKKSKKPTTVVAWGLFIDYYSGEIVKRSFRHFASNLQEWLERHFETMPFFYPLKIYAWKREVGPP